MGSFLKVYWTTLPPPGNPQNDSAPAKIIAIAHETRNLNVLQESSSLPVNKSFSSGQEICFSIRPSLGGRKGWKIMPEAGGDAIEDPGITFNKFPEIVLCCYHRLLQNFLE